MGNFRNERRGGFGNRERSNGRFGERGRGRSFGGRRDEGFSGERRGFSGRGRFEKHEVICDKCGKQCEVPFKPTGDKPVYCSDCFRKTDTGAGSSSRNFSPRSSETSSQGISKEQFNQLNAKLDKILEILSMIEFEEDEETEEEGEEDSGEGAIG